MKNLVLIFVLALIVAQPALANREDIVPILNSITENTSNKITISINEGNVSMLRIGEPLRINIASRIDAYIAIVHMDDNGVTSLVTPKFIDGSNHIKAGTERSYPTGQDGVEFETSAPIGTDSIYVIATEKPLTLSDNPADTAPGTVVELGVDVDKIKNLKDAVLKASRDSRNRATKMLSYLVTGRSGPTQYVRNDIVAYFTASSTRSLKKPKMPADIKFEFDSDKLTDEARANLDEWGKSLNHPSMKKMKFVIAGYTDDVGDDNYNMVLSGKRAKAVLEYLVKEHSIDKSRLMTEAHGEMNPIMKGTSEEARKQNRRVEFMLSMD